jgi:hypothetical protein
VDTLQQALRGAQHSPPPALRLGPPLLVVGAGGTLGAALLAESLVVGRFQQVGAVVDAPLGTALRGLKAVPAQAWLNPQPGAVLPQADMAFLVFERERHANGRDQAFTRPEPADLLTWAQRLRASGVRRLVVLVPHAPSLLPDALRAGFATEAEHAVAGLGFEQLVFLRPSQTAGAAAPGRSAVQRVADWWLSQLRWMVAEVEKPVLSVQLASVCMALARQLTLAPPGTRVLPQPVLAQAARGDADAVLAAWLGVVAPADVAAA